MSDQYCCCLTKMLAAHVLGSPQNHYNFHPGNGQYQPAMVTIQHDNPPQQDFKTIVIRFPSVRAPTFHYLILLTMASQRHLSPDCRSCRGTGFLGASSDLSHVVALSDVPRLALLQIQDCSHCKIVVQLGQHDRLLCIEVLSCDSPVTHHLLWGKIFVATCLKRGCSVIIILTTWYTVSVMVLFVGLVWSSCKDAAS